jgi:hypothetical protein
MRNGRFGLVGISISSPPEQLSSHVHVRAAAVFNVCLDADFSAADLVNFSRGSTITKRCFSGYDLIMTECLSTWAACSRKVQEDVDRHRCVWKCFGASERGTTYSCLRSHQWELLQCVGVMVDSCEASARSFLGKAREANENRSEKQKWPGLQGAKNRNSRAYRGQEERAYSGQEKHKWSGRGRGELGKVQEDKNRLCRSLNFLLYFLKPFTTHECVYKNRLCRPLNFLLYFPTPYTTHECVCHMSAASLEVWFVWAGLAAMTFLCIASLFWRWLRGYLFAVLHPLKINVGILVLAFIRKSATLDGDAQDMHTEIQHKCFEKIQTQGS